MNDPAGTPTAIIHPSATIEPVSIGKWLLIRDSSPPESAFEVSRWRGGCCRCGGHEHTWWMRETFY